MTADVLERPQTSLPTRIRTVRRVSSRRARIGRRAALAALALWWLVPLVPVLLWSLADRWPYPAVLPTQWGTSGWASAWHQGAGAALLRSLAVAAVVTAVATPLGAAAGRALAMHRVRWSGAVTVALVLPVAVPPFAVVMGLSTVSLRWGVPGNVALVLVLVTAAIPYTTFVMRSAYASYDVGFEEEARTLGASPLLVLRRVHLPLVLPALAVAGFLAFLTAWSDYVVTLLLGAGRLVTLSQLIGSTAAGSGNEPTVAALSVLTVLPPVLLLLAVSRLSGARR
jgi:putative spermidine/putrescine transport system permease protein